MAVGNRNADKKRLKAFGVAFRDGAYGHIGGAVTCETCGNNLVNLSEIAYLAGTTPANTAKWLRRQPLRPDVAERIRSLFKRVVE